MIKAVGKNVIVQPITEEHKSSAGIIIGDSKKAPSRGVVIAVGSSVTEVAVDEIVLFSYTQQVRAFKEAGCDYLTMPELAIDAIIG